MSKKYDEYIREHRENVFKAFCWLDENLPEIFENEQIKADCRHFCEYEHDHTKFEDDEYEAYDAYFYGGNRSYEVVQNFNKAWLKHIHRNEHHWQHWVLINDNPDEGEIILDMPDEYIIEMICDWWSFSWKKGNLFEIFDWYDERKEHMKLSAYTRGFVESALLKIKMKLHESDSNDE